MRKIFFFLLGVPLFFATISKADGKVSGYIDFLNSEGKFQTEPASMVIPSDFKGPVRIEWKDRSLTSTKYQFVRAIGQRVFTVAFTDLPENKKNVSLILSGVYHPGKNFIGEAFTKVNASDEEKTQSLAEFSAAANFTNFVSAGSFSFGDRPNPKQPQVRTTGSGNPNNPMPDGPGWSTGGVGRYAEYYAGGPIQNPGGPSVAATFERGVPYAWTRQGQMEAQRIGIQRTAAFNRAHYNNFNWSFGFFFR